jgi:hypothetical protein
MPKHPSTDPNLFAKAIVDNLIAKYDPDSLPAKPTPEEPAQPEKNPAAVALGRLGGHKGGLARAANLSPKQRSQAAKKAAIARWNKKPTSQK